MDDTSSKRNILLWIFQIIRKWMSKWSNGRRKIWDIHVLFLRLCSKEVSHWTTTNYFFHAFDRNRSFHSQKDIKFSGSEIPIDSWFKFPIFLGALTCVDPPHLYLFVLSTAQNTQVPNGWWFELDLLYTKSGTDVFHTKSPSRDEVEARWGQR